MELYLVTKSSYHQGKIIVGIYTDAELANKAVQEIKGGYYGFVETVEANTNINLSI